MAKLLDTNIFVDYFRNKEKAVRYLKKTITVTTSIIVAAELIQGARDRKEQKIVEEMLKRIELLPITKATGETMLYLLKSYSLSHNLEIPDALIAATSMKENMILVTGNHRHFKMIKGLKLEKW